MCVCWVEGVDMERDKEDTIDEASSGNGEILMWRNPLVVRWGWGWVSKRQKGSDKITKKDKKG